MSAPLRCPGCGTPATFDAATLGWRHDDPNRVWFDCQPRAAGRWKRADGRCSTCSGPLVTFKGDRTPVCGSGCATTRPGRTINRTVSRPQIRASDCTFCTARAGEPCSDDHGYPVTWFHNARKSAARLALK